MGAMVLEGVPKVPLSAWDGPFSVTWYVNLRACVAFQVSQVSEEMDAEELRFRDERFPLTVAARALGHWGEMLLFWMDRADSLSGVAKHLERRVSDYITANIHITSSGMLQERLLRHALDFTGADRVLFSTDYPFHRPDATAVGQFFDAIPDPAERIKIASGNAEALFRLT
jgi:Amidohydrolase